MFVASVVEDAMELDVADLQGSVPRRAKQVLGVLVVSAVGLEEVRLEEGAFAASRQSRLMLFVHRAFRCPFCSLRSSSFSLSSSTVILSVYSSLCYIR